MRERKSPAQAGGSTGDRGGPPRLRQALTGLRIRAALNISPAPVTVSEGRCPNKAPRSSDSKRPRAGGSTHGASSARPRWVRVAALRRERLRQGDRRVNSAELLGFRPARTPPPARGEDDPPQARDASPCETVVHATTLSIDKTLRHSHKQKGGPKAAPVVAAIWRTSQPKRFDDPDQQARNPEPHVDQPEFAPARGRRGPRATSFGRRRS